MDDRRFRTAPHAAARHLARMPLLLALGMTTMVSGCFGAIEDEEALFYARAAALAVGATSATLERELGLPTRIARPDPACREAGGRATWIYEYTPVEDGRQWLAEGPCVYCLDRDGRVLAREVRVGLADHTGRVLVR